ncbi:MAG: glycoside hydrolase family 2 protein [Ruminococcaceae bacterium]|nr:glycoside hydrolase family 2 protein [Oscillospiraceae bacterium]
MQSLCNSWEFTPQFSIDFANGLGEGESVRLPHTTAELPLHCADHHAYQMICGYRRTLHIGAQLQGKRLFLQFDGAAHIATVYVNGQETITHRCGYTAFRVEITDLVNYGQDNLIAIRLDSTENPEIPPFGFVIDYLTYGGLYREVWLDIRESSFISDIYITTPTTDTARVQLTVENRKRCTATAEILDPDGKALAHKEISLTDSTDLTLPDARPWSTEDPFRYTCRICLFREGVLVDTQKVLFGFRTAQFRKDGFYLNGQKVFIRGLNRHQCYPYIGYAATEHLQREDARILKEELCCNAVRTSHYPQSQHFIDECDRLGLLVFTEIPGWQHIGDAAWKDQAVENTREMVLQYRNHPSIILWGVRINESMDDDPFYKRTNAIAHELDPSRATSGVRCIVQSSLLEDVYSYNDFSHTGDNPGVRKKKTVTPDMGKALLVTECNGHMFPTKSFDDWQHRQSHALRHARVQNDAAASGEHAGCFAWCMFDYATHKDFGSGDRICYHGVMDSFRNPKLAAAVYASQGNKNPVLQISTSNDIGDYPAGVAGTTYAITNADEVALYKNGLFVSKLAPSEFMGLKHGPMAVTDTIGCLLETQEGYPKAKADIVRKCLNAVGKYGVTSLPPREIARVVWAMLRYGLTYKDAIALYGKYTSSWGSEAVVWRFDAIKDGKVVASVTRSASTKLHLEVTASQTTLTEGDSYDMAAIRIRILDEFGNPVPYAQLPVWLELTGEASLVGPKVVTAEGGMCGTYIRTTGKSGNAQLTISTGQTEPVTIDFTIA